MKEILTSEVRPGHQVQAWAGDFYEVLSVQQYNSSRLLTFTNGRTLEEWEWAQVTVLR